MGAFLVMTVVIFGGAAAMTGQALARNWRPVWQVLPYALLLGIGDRFLLYALFGARLISAEGYAAAVLILLAIGLVAYRLTQTHCMVRQYPWLYERSGPFQWRARGPGEHPEAAGADRVGGGPG
jgi:hypothetical protein